MKIELNINLIAKTILFYGKTQKKSYFLGNNKSS